MKWPCRWSVCAFAFKFGCCKDLQRQTDSRHGTTSLTLGAHRCYRMCRAGNHAKSTGQPTGSKILDCSLTSAGASNVPLKLMSGLGRCSQAPLRFCVHEPAGSTCKTLPRLSSGPTGWPSALYSCCAPFFCNCSTFCLARSNQTWPMKSGLNSVSKR